MVKLPVVAVSGGFVTPFMVRDMPACAGIVVTDDEAFKLEIVIELLPESYVQVGRVLRLIPINDAQLVCDFGGVTVEGKVILIIPWAVKGFDVVMVNA